MEFTSLTGKDVGNIVIRSTLSKTGDALGLDPTCNCMYSCFSKTFGHGSPKKELLAQTAQEDFPKHMRDTVLRESVEWQRPMWNAPH